MAPHLGEVSATGVFNKNGEDREDGGTGGKKERGPAGWALTHKMARHQAMVPCGWAESGNSEDTRRIDVC
jgi:hypothetical protein